MDFSTWPSTILTIGVGLLVVVVLFFLIALALRLLGWIFRILGAFLAIAFYPLAVVIILLLAGVGWYQYRPPSNVRAETAISNPPLVCGSGNKLKASITGTVLSNATCF